MYTDIEELKLSKQINGETIQSLSASISYITSQLQDLVNKNKTGSNIFTLPKQPCVSDELTDYADADRAGVDNIFVIQESTNPRTNNGSTTEPRPIKQSQLTTATVNYVDADSGGVDNYLVIQESTNLRTNNGSTTEPYNLMCYLVNVYSSR